MAPLKQLLSRLSRLRIRPTRRLKLTKLTPDLCLLPQPAFESHAPPATLDGLPPELVILILEYAGPDAILICTSVCRRFHDLVASSSVLQYQVALVLAGFDDAGGHVAPGDRLKSLQARSSAWRSFQYRDRLSIDIGTGAFRPCYDLHSGIFFVGRRSGPNLPIRALSWLPLPSIDNRSIGTWQSLPLDISIDDFALDLRQDLLVLVEMLVPNTTTVNIHLRSFQNLANHPKAAIPSLNMECAPVTSSSTIVVDLAGKHLGLLFSHDHHTRSDYDRLRVWDWTTGETVFFLQGTSTKLTSFVFLMDDVLLVPDVAANALAVFRKRSEQRQFELTHLHGLPELQDGCTLHNANSRYKSRGVHKPAKGSHALPGDADPPAFYVQPEMELVVVSLEYRAEGWGHFFTLICTKDAFLHPPRRTAGIVRPIPDPLPFRATDAAPPPPSPIAILPTTLPAAPHQPLALAGTSVVHSPVAQTAATPPPAASIALPSPPISTPSPTAELLVPWDAWGPMGTRMIREPLRLWDYFHASTRFLSLSSSAVGGIDDEDSSIARQRVLSGTRAHLRLLDFNPCVVARAACCAPEPSFTMHELPGALPTPDRETESTSGDAAGTPPLAWVDGTMQDSTRRVRVVRDSAPNIVRTGPLFKRDVFTRLPYVETTTTSAFEIANVMCDHERVIGLKTNAVLDMESLDVFLL